MADTERLVSEGRLSKPQPERLKRKLKDLEVEFLNAAEDGQDIEVLISRIQARFEKECNGMTSICLLGEPDTNAFNRLIKEGKWMRVRNGVTMDSGCAVFVMPSEWLTMFALKESEGSEAGRTYVAAAKDGKPIKNEGQRTVQFLTF